MKQKVNKKLVLNQETVANLNIGELRIAQGGVSPMPTDMNCTRTDCPECDPDVTADTWEPSICCETGFGVC